MRFSFIDFFIASLSIALGAALTQFLISPSGDVLSIVLRVFVGGILYLSFTPLIYKHFHLKPLLFPKCPVCFNNHRHYQWTDKNWPSIIVKCSNCNSSIQLIFEKIDNSRQHDKTPTFLLRWPQSVGCRWKY